jgi:hypothetical protein
VTFVRPFDREISTLCSDERTIIEGLWSFLNMVGGGGVILS